MAPLSGFALKTPWGQAVMAKVLESNPDYQGTNYGVRQNAMRAFATGVQGNAIRSFNTSLEHLDTLKGLVGALGGGDTKLLNRLSQGFAAQFGAPAPTNFDAAKHIVGDEIVKAIVGAGGGVADRENAAATIDRANSPEQLLGVIKTYQDLMLGQLHGLKRQYEAIPGNPTDFDRFLSPSARALIGVAPGTVKSGYRFKGGDPSDKKNWERVKP
jgi:hypothetical protein